MPIRITLKRGNKRKVITCTNPKARGKVYFDHAAGKHVKYTTRRKALLHTKRMVAKWGILNSRLEGKGRFSKGYRSAIRKRKQISNHWKLKNHWRPEKSPKRRNPDKLLTYKQWREQDIKQKMKEYDLPYSEIVENTDDGFLDWMNESKKLMADGAVPSQLWINTVLGEKGDWTWWKSFLHSHPLVFDRIARDAGRSVFMTKKTFNEPKIRIPKRRNPELKAKRSVEFEDFGTYDVVMPDGRTAVISRDVGGTGWWYISWSGLHYSQCMLGFSKKEALENLEQKIAVMERSHGAMPVYQHAKRRNPKHRKAETVSDLFLMGVKEGREMLKQMKNEGWYDPKTSISDMIRSTKNAMKGASSQVKEMNKGELAFWKQQQKINRESYENL